MMRNCLLAKFYQHVFSWLLLPLLPLEPLARWIIARRFAKRQLIPNQQPPVIVVGNITLGGVGKSPIVAALALHWQQQKNARVVIISRGYGAVDAQSSVYPQMVTAASDAAQCGDEPVMLAQQTGCPVVIAPKRLEAYQYAVDVLSAEVVIADDGLQHYALPRAYEICVIDAQRYLGNGHCLPAGPLREPPSRLEQVDALLIDADSPFVKKVAALRTPHFSYARYSNTLCDARTFEVQAVDTLIAAHGRRVHAVCAIGNPKPFFESLRALGFELVEHAFNDHHRFTANDVDFSDTLPIIMTHKDAVKCRALGLENAWVLRLDVSLPEALLADIEAKTVL